MSYNQSQLFVYDPEGRIHVIDSSFSEINSSCCSTCALINSAQCHGCCNEVYTTYNQHILVRDSKVPRTGVCRLHYKLLGGKGGFGSMLRTLGAQIEKTTNREAMRDLSGRRLRDVNNEKKLADWVLGAADREKERQKKKEERLEKRKAEIEGKKHRFKDEKYMKQKETVTSNLDDAVMTGLKRASTSQAVGPSSKKGKAKALPVLAGAGIDLDDLSSDSDNDSASSAEEPVPEIVSEEPGAEAVSEPHPEQPNSAERDADPQTVDVIAMQIPSESQPEHVVPSDSAIPSTSSSTSDETTVSPLNLDDFPSSSDLHALSLDVLKRELLSRNMKCGGTLVERAVRLFSVKGLMNDQIPTNLLVKKKK